MRRFVAIATLLAAATTAGRAQERDVAVGQAPSDSALGQVHPGDVIRVRTLDGRLVASRLVALEAAPVPARALQPAPLQFRFSGQPAPVPVASVDSLWVRGHASRLGSRVGMAVGAIGLGLYGLWACSDPEVGIAPWACAGFAIPLGGLPGGVLGFLVGSAIPRWDLRFPVP
jgi:hypothetical protein